MGQVWLYLKIRVDSFKLSLSHPAALGMLTLWRTVTKAGPPSLLAIDTTNGTVYFALDISEGNDATKSVLRDRVKVVGRHITELACYMRDSAGNGRVTRLRKSRHFLITILR